MRLVLRLGKSSKLAMASARLRATKSLSLCTDSVIHLVATPEPPAPASPRPWMLDAQQSCPEALFPFAQDAKVASMKTA